MDFSSMPCEESAAAKSLKKNMAKYCMNTMRKRTIDEQLGDFSVIMECPLDLRIVYKRTELDVSYRVGSLSASVTGSDESMCVRQCKRDVLHKLKVFCGYINDGARTSSSDWLARSVKSPSESNSKTQDVYSEIELSKERVTEKEARKAFDKNIVLVDPEMDVSSELCEFVYSNESPLVLTVSYLPAEWKMTWDCGPYSASIDGPLKSMCMQECKMLLLHKLSVFVTDENPVDEKAVNTDDPTRIAMANRDDDSREDNLQKLIDYEKSHGNVSNESVSTIGPQVDSDHSIVSAVESDHITSDSSNESWNHMINVQDVIRSVCNRKNEIAQKQSISSEIQRCDPPSQNRINEPAVEPVARPRETMNRIPESTELPVTTFNEHPRISSNIIELQEKYVSRASAVLKNVMWDTFQNSVEQFFVILVQTNHANEFYMKMITDCLVSNAIDKPDSCALYATLCCHVIKKANMDSRNIIRPGLSSAFKINLIQSCRDVLTKEGVLLSRMETARQPQENPRPSEQKFDVESRNRTQGTCRLMGELFMRGQMFKTVMKTIDTFMHIHNAHSLECICVLLTIIGPEFEKITDVSRQVYEQLKSYVIAGYAGNTLLPPRTIHKIDIILNIRLCYTNGWNSWSGDFVEERTTNAGNRCHRRHRHGREVQWEDRHANRISRDISRYSRNPRSCTTSTFSHVHRNH